MANFNYNTYHFIGNALTEDKFLELKYHFQSNRNLIEQLYKVNYLKEIFTEFKPRLILILITTLASIAIYLFAPSKLEKDDWLGIFFLIAFGATILNGISLIISLISFLSYLDHKRRYGTVHLYLLEVSADFKSYMDNYLKYNL